MILSGRVDRRFVPIGKILKPLINECVTPVTCYWSLALLLRDEEELLLVFQVKLVLFFSRTAHEDCASFHLR